MRTRRRVADGDAARHRPVPTRRGAALLAAAPVLLAGGTALGYPELVVLGGAATLAVAVALAHVAVPQPLAVTRLADPERVTRGEPSHVRLTVTRSGARRGPLTGYDGCGSGSLTVRVPAGRRHTVHYPVPTHRRGVVPVGPLRVVRRDPLGLARLTRAHGGVQRVWVYPLAHRLTAVPPGVARSLDGRLDRVPHGSITFDTLRGYVLGDDLRHVHWRTSARAGALMVREYVDTSLPRLVVLLDDRVGANPAGEDGYSPRFEAACEAAASLAVAAAREEVPLHLVFASDPTGAGAHPASGTAAHHPAGTAAHHPAGTAAHRAAGTAARAGGISALDRLAGAAPHGSTGALAGAARLLYGPRRGGDTLVVLTGGADPADLAVLRGLRETYPVVVVASFHPDAVSTMDAGMRVLAVADGPGFAAAWDGIAAW